MQLRASANLSSTAFNRETTSGNLSKERPQLSSRVLYQRVPKLFAGLALARGDGRYARILRSLAGVQLLIIDLCAAHSYVERRGTTPGASWVLPPANST
jgi:hypothetical protein